MTTFEAFVHRLQEAVLHRHSGAGLRVQLPGYAPAAQRDRPGVRRTPARKLPGPVQTGAQDAPRPRVAWRPRHRRLRRRLQPPSSMPSPPGPPTPSSPTNSAGHQRAPRRGDLQGLATQHGPHGLQAAGRKPHQPHPQANPQEQAVGGRRNSTISAHLLQKLHRDSKPKASQERPHRANQDGDGQRRGRRGLRGRGGGRGQRGQGQEEGKREEHQGQEEGQRGHHSVRPQPAPSPPPFPRPPARIADRCTG